MNYSKLKGIIREKYKTQEAFAKALDLSLATLSKKLNNQSQWTCSEIMKACELLGIALAEAHLYFFCTAC